MEGKVVSVVVVVIACVLGQALGQSTWCLMLGGNCLPTGTCTGTGGTVLGSNLLCSAAQECCRPYVATLPPAAPPTPTTTLATTPPSTAAPVTTGLETTPAPYGPWSLWSPCSSTCGEGLMQRARACNHAQCPGPWDFQTGPCESGPCPAWGVWSPWSPCSVTCGGGLRQRRRACFIEGTSISATTCPGNDTEMGACATDLCPDPVCGRSQGLIARMFGSQLSTRCDAPWVAHFQLTPAGLPEAVTACSGVLIDSNSVLTTAMCAKMVEDFVNLDPANPNPNNVRLTVGDFDASLLSDGVVTGISSFLYPGNYSLREQRPSTSGAADPVLTEWGLAVVQLSSPVEAGPCQNAACLPDSYRQLNRSRCRVHSFGARGLENDVQLPTNILQEADPQLNGATFCDAALSFSQADYPGLEAFSRHFYCASRRDSYNFCKGDEAAVLTCQDATTLQWTAVGLGRLYPDVAAAPLDGSACTAPSRPVIFARVEPLLPWVRQAMAAN